MTKHETYRRPVARFNVVSRVGLVNPASTLAAFLVICFMLILSIYLTGPSSGDWLGYAQLYGDQGGWLLDKKRDPGFILVIDSAHSLFGKYGYQNFRILLSTIFVAFATWVVCSMPMQVRLPQISSIVTALIVVSAFSLKSFVQIREGLAFLFVIVPTVAMFAKSRSGLFLSAFGTLGALTLHSGAVVLGAVWLIALTLMAFSDRLVSRRILHTAMLLVSLVMGAGLGAFTILHAHDVRLFLGSYGVNVHAKPVGGVAKDIYWLLNGLIALKIRSEVLKAAVGTRRFAFCYASSVASVAIPVMYTICFTLVILSFTTPALTSIMIRLFFTVTELGMIIVALRGRANLATLLIAIFMLWDRLRAVGEAG